MRPRSNLNEALEEPPLESGMDHAAAQGMIDVLWDDSVVPALSKFIEIPSQSPLFDPEWETNGLLDQSIQVLVDWVRNQKIEGLSVEIVAKEGCTPVIFLEVEPTGAGGARPRSEISVRVAFVLQICGWVR